MVGGRVVVGLVSLSGGPYPLFSVYDDIMTFDHRLLVQLSSSCCHMMIITSIDLRSFLSQPLSKALSLPELYFFIFRL